MNITIVLEVAAFNPRLQQMHVILSKTTCETVEVVVRKYIVIINIIDLFINNAAARR